MEIRFRRLVDDDLVMLHRWLNDPRVVQWWEGDDVSWPGVLADHGSDRRDPDDRAEHWIAMSEGRPLGWIQCSPVTDDPDAAELARFGVGPDAAQIDYLIGDGARRRRGLGTAMIDAFVTDVVFGRHPQWHRVCAVPYGANRASWRALERAGFHLVGEIHDHRGTARVMLRHRDAEPAGP